MIERSAYLQQLTTAIRRSPVTALLGARQVGKTPLARAFAQGKEVTFFDLESQPDLRRLQNPELVLGSLAGLVVIDEIQVKPELFGVLRVLVDRPENRARFLILGSNAVENHPVSFKWVRKAVEDNDAKIIGSGLLHLFRK